MMRRTVDAISLYMRHNDSIGSSATNDDSMPGYKNNLFTIQAIRQNACLAVNLDCARLFTNVYSRHFGSKDELNSIIQNRI
jgi:hypothetical protein